MLENKILLSQSGPAFSIRIVRVFAGTIDRAEEVERIVFVSYLIEKTRNQFQKPYHLFLLSHPFFYQ